MPYCLRYKLAKTKSSTNLQAFCPTCKSLNPYKLAHKKSAPVIQLEEYRITNPKATGSRPVGGTLISIGGLGKMGKVAVACINRDTDSQSVPASTLINIGKGLTLISRCQIEPHNDRSHYAEPNSV